MAIRSVSFSSGRWTVAVHREHFGRSRRFRARLRCSSDRGSGRACRGQGPLGPHADDLQGTPMERAVISPCRVSPDAAGRGRAVHAGGSGTTSAISGYENTGDAMAPDRLMRRSGRKVQFLKSNAIAHRSARGGGDDELRFVQSSPGSAPGQYCNCLRERPRAAARGGLDECSCRRRPDTSSDVYLQSPGRGRSH